MFYWKLHLESRGKTYEDRKPNKERILEAMETKGKQHSMDKHIKPMHFLFDNYRPQSFDHEVYECARRIWFCMIIPLLANTNTSTAKRALYGLITSLMYALVFREKQPWNQPDLSVSCPRMYRNAQRF